MNAANGTGQHTFRFFRFSLIPETATAGSGLPPALHAWAQAGQQAGKGTRYRPRPNDEKNKEEQKDDQKEFEDEHARSKKRSLRMTPPV
jgi:hypothetical protein